MIWQPVPKVALKLAQEIGQNGEAQNRRLTLCEVLVDAEGVTTLEMLADEYAPGGSVVTVATYLRLDPVGKTLEYRVTR